MKLRARPILIVEGSAPASRCVQGSGAEKGGRGEGAGGGRGGNGRGASVIAPDNHKSALQDLCSKLKLKQPVFTVQAAASCNVLQWTSATACLPADVALT
jgi:hypothetical protein